MYTYDPISCALWFGTERYMGWFPTPESGADSSPSGWQDSAQLLNGGAVDFSSFGSHKSYQYDWGDANSRQVAQLMKSFADGSYGRGLVYFHDPLTFDTNVLPARVADPSIAADYEGATLVYGVQPSTVPAAPGPNMLPVNSTQYNMNTITPGFVRGAGGVFIPIPEGFSLVLSAFYTRTGTGGVFWTGQDLLGSTTGVNYVTPLAESATRLSSAIIPWSSSRAGIWLWVGKSGAGAATISLRAMMGRLIRSEHAVNGNPAYEEIVQGPWIGGQGHSGCVFSGKPTYVEQNGVNGGQVEFSASFVEVGSWANG